MSGSKNVSASFWFSYVPPKRHRSEIPLCHVKLKRPSGWLSYPCCLYRHQREKRLASQVCGLTSFLPRACVNTTELMFCLEKWGIKPVNNTTYMVCYVFMESWLHISNRYLCIQARATTTNNLWTAVKPNPGQKPSITNLLESLKCYSLYCFTGYYFWMLITRLRSMM